MLENGDGAGASRWGAASPYINGMRSTNTTWSGGIPRWRVVLAAVATAALPGGCGGDGDPGRDPGSEDAAMEAGIAAVPTDTAPQSPQTDPDQAGPAEGLEAGADTTDPAIDSVAGDTTGLPEPPVQLRVPPGTRVRLTAEIDISTDEYDVGDPVIATVVQDVMDEAGETLIPRGTYFLGRVEASASSGGIGEPAILEVAFETLSAWNYERPIESVVVDAPMMLDPEAERARRSGSGRDALRSVPGIIAAGSVIVVQLREAVLVPPVDPLLADTASAVDTVATADTVPREQY
ncbi:MAG: hypothetical protein OXI83_12835 [Gemmatimonadota bacterium]|nr:hypothetical protein [Gemmatimonadota bacterium]